MFAITLFPALYMLWVLKLCKYERRINLKSYIARLFVDIDEEAMKSKSPYTWASTMSALIARKHLMPFLKRYKRPILAIAGIVGILSFLSVLSIEPATDIPKILPSSNDIQRYLELQTEYVSTSVCHTCAPALKVYTNADGNFVITGSAHRDKGIIFKPPTPQSTTKNPTPMPTPPQLLMPYVIMQVWT